MALDEKEIERIMHIMTVKNKGCRADIASKLLEGGERLLDIGCGDGAFTVMVRDKYKEVYGIDVSTTLLNVAKKRGTKTFKVDLNTRPLPFEDNQFDAVTCLDVIEHVLKPEDFVREIHRVLKKNGTLIISTPNIRYWRNILSILRGRFPLSEDRNSEEYIHCQYFTFGDIEEILEKHGFEVIEKKGTFGKNFLIEFRSVQVMIKARKSDLD